MVVRAKSPGRSRRRQERRQILGFILLSLALLASALLIRQRNSAEAKIVEHETVVAEFDTISVPVPVDLVPSGTALSAIRFKRVSFPQHQIPRNAVLDLDLLAGSVTIAALPANLPVFSENFSRSVGGMNPVIERIPSGMRAMTISVDATSAVEGWAGSGAIVDVLLVQKDKTSLIAEQVKILSAERSVAPVDNNGTPSVPKTVTLLVTQEQCLAINTAIALGKIAFALRGAKDESIWRTVSFSSSQLGNAGKSRSSSISGYIAVGAEDNQRQYALSDGKWIPTEVIPDGFLVEKRRDAKE